LYAAGSAPFVWQHFLRQQFRYHSICPTKASLLSGRELQAIVLHSRKTALNWSRRCPILQRIQPIRLLRAPRDGLSLELIDEGTRALMTFTSSSTSEASPQAHAQVWDLRNTQHPSLMWNFNVEGAASLEDVYEVNNMCIFSSHRASTASRVARYKS
jgi:hypothetical protein